MAKLSTTSVYGDLFVSGNINSPSAIFTNNIQFNMYNSTATPIEVYGGDSDGQGIAIGAGGATIISSGEGKDQIKANLGATVETMSIGSDQTIEFHTALQNGWASRKSMTMGTDGKLTNSNGFVGTLSGNATTATTLATARTINGVSFNGSANITIPIIHRATAAPTNKEIFWVDTNYTPNILKFWNGSAWEGVNTYQ